MLLFFIFDNKVISPALGTLNLFKTRLVAFIYNSKSPGYINRGFFQDLLLSLKAHLLIPLIEL